MGRDTSSGEGDTMNKVKAFNLWWKQYRDTVIDMLLGKTDGIPVEYIWMAGWNAAKNQADTAKILMRDSFEITFPTSTQIVIEFKKDTVAFEEDRIILNLTYNLGLAPGRNQ